MALGLVAFAGVIGNVLTCVVLGKISLNNVFNQLIVMLCAFDTLYDCFCIVEYPLKKVIEVEYFKIQTLPGWCWECRTGNETRW